jgi:3-deoxy-manno-octulosonate cytidylyltransferase (CMP-KDO synthetase)
MRIAAIIPARFGSTRFPGKPLAQIAGRPMVERVYLRVAKALLPDEVWIATDDERIFNVVKAFGGKAVLTHKPAVSGTDRIAEALDSIPAEIVINVQGDEPMIDPSSIDLVAQALVDDDALQVATLAYPIHSRSQFEDPNVVKVVRDQHQNALYFSRAPIPPGGLNDSQGLKHLGIYAYRRELIQSFTTWDPTACESSERLEQLRLLEHGIAIRVLDARVDSHSVDSPGDVATIEGLIQAQECVSDAQV